MAVKESKNKSLNITAGISIIIFAFIISPWDCKISMWLADNNIDWFSSFFSNSFFEGTPFGAGDPATLLMISSGLLYIASWLPQYLPKIFHNACNWRPELGFLFFSTILTAVCVVHGLKYIVGRARPNTIIDHSEAFSYFFETGPYNILHHSFHGSFPSGHTATMTILISFAYIATYLIRPALRPEARPDPKKIYITLAVALCILMSIARSMTYSHFITDGLVVIGINWLIIHTLFFFLLDIPAQKRIQSESGKPVELPFMWELRMSLYALAATAFIALSVSGYREAIHTEFFSSSLLYFASLLASLFFIFKLHMLFRTGKQKFTF